MTTETKQVPVEPTEEFLEQLKKRTADWIGLSEKGARRLYDLFISLAATPAAGGHYTEGICGDGAAILCDGQPLTISEVLRRLNTAPSTNLTEISSKLVEPSEVERLAVEAADHLQAWLDSDLCDCDGDHVCGRRNVQRTVDRIRKTLKPTRPEEGGSDGR